MANIIKTLFKSFSSYDNQQETSMIRTMSVKNNNAVEYNNLEKSVENWKIPKIPINEIYHLNYSFPLRTSHYIKTIEKTLSIDTTQKTIQLLSLEDLKQIQSVYKYNYLHIGLVQVAVRPLTRRGLNTAALGCLRDCRNLKFADSLLGLIEASLSNGPVFFNTCPDFSVSLTDPNILDCLTLNLQTSGYEMKPGMENVAVTYRIYLKAMTTLSPGVKRITPKGLTTLFVANPRNNVITPKELKWDEIVLPEKWNLLQVTEPQKALITEASKILETPDGDVEIEFTSSRRITLDRRFSTSTVPLTEKEKGQPSPSNIAYASYEPSLADLGLNMIEIEEEFQIDKELLRKDFDSEHNREKKQWFLTTYDRDKQSFIRRWWYSQMEEEKKNILFFEWFEKGYIPGTEEARPEIQVVVINCLSKTWKTVRGTEEISIHPPFETIQLEGGVRASPLKMFTKGLNENTKVEHLEQLVEQQNFTNIALKTIGKQTERIETILLDKKEETSKVVHNYLNDKRTPQIKTVKLPQNNGSSSRSVPPIIRSYEMDAEVKLGPSFSEELINELGSKMTALKLKDGVNYLSNEEDETSSELSFGTTESCKDEINKISTYKNVASRIKNYYPRPTYADLQYEETPDTAVAVQFDGRSLVEWNLDGLSEYQIFTLCHQMIMYSNACKVHGNNEKSIAQMIVSSFSGQLRGWWDNYLTNQQRLEILNSIKRDPEGNHLPNNPSDAVITLILNIMYHFVGDYQDIYEKIREQLINLRCRTMSDFRWYKDTFLSKLYQLPDPNQEFWKEKFISGLPPLFAEKVRSHLRNEGEGCINYTQLDMGKITQKVQRVGAELCNDLKIQNLLKKQKMLGRKELGEFCYQFGFQLDKPYQKRKKGPKREDREYQGKNPKRRPRETSKKFKTKSYSKKGKREPLMCYKCNQEGHYANKCRQDIKRKIQEISEEKNSEDLREKLESLLTSLDLDSEKESEGCSCGNEHSGSNTSDTEVLVLSNEEQFIMDLIESLKDPEERKDQIMKFFTLVKTQGSKPPLDSEKPIEFDSIDEVFQRLRKTKQKNVKTTREELLFEQNQIKHEVQLLKDRVLDDLEYVADAVKAVGVQELVRFVGGEVGGEGAVRVALAVLISAGGAGLGRPGGGGGGKGVTGGGVGFGGGGVNGHD